MGRLRIREDDLRSDAPMVSVKPRRAYRPPSPATICRVPRAEACAWILRLLKTNGEMTAKAIGQIIWCSVGIRSDPFAYAMPATRMLQRLEREQKVTMSYYGATRVWRLA